VFAAELECAAGLCVQQELQKQHPCLLGWLGLAPLPQTVPLAVQLWVMHEMLRCGAC
jgi:hypothetical protein